MPIYNIQNVDFFYDADAVYKVLSENVKTGGTLRRYAENLGISSDAILDFLELALIAAKEREILVKSYRNHEISNEVSG